MTRRPAAALAAVTAALAALAAPPPSDAWGFTAHRLVNRKAVATLPLPLRRLFEENLAYVSEHAVDPDLWRTAGLSGEAPNHYLDLDAFGEYPSPGLARIEAEHLARHGPDAIWKGRLPWRVGEIYRELVAAFRNRDAARALERAAVLGHYVGDAYVPLHAVLNYDGQLTGQPGIHDRWESHLVERLEGRVASEVRPGPARSVTDSVALTFDALTESFRGAADVLASDRACAGPRGRPRAPGDQRYDDAYYSRLVRREQGRVVSRLTASAAAVGSLWLSAWEEAGRPALPGYRIPYVRRQAKAVLVSLDGASATVVDDAIARGLMPNLARVRAEGAAARGAVTSLPSRTAAAHAALFTGAWGDRNGITGNDVPIQGGSVLEQGSGSLSTHLVAEPLWVTGARQGIEVTVATATQVFPFDPYLEERRFGGNFGRSLTLFEGYREREEQDAVYRAADLPPRRAEGWTALPPHQGAPRELVIDVMGTPVHGLIYDDPADPVVGFDTLYLTARNRGAGGVTLKPRPAGADPSAFATLALRVRGNEPTGVHFRLFALSPDASEMLLYRTRAHVIRSTRPGAAAGALEATGGFVGNGAIDRYEHGAFGPPIWAGGDGTAERRYLETVALVVRQMTRLTDYAMDRTPWWLLVTYLPFPDEPLHVWLGYLDRSLPGHDPALAARFQPFLDDSLRLADAFVGHLRERAGGDTVLVVAADHGMVGANALVRPNVTLARAGILASGNGHVDLSRTRAVYFPGNSGYVLLNRVGRPGGIVRPDEEDAVRREVETALRGIEDPATGGRAVVDVLDPRSGADTRIGGPAGGDLYVTVASRYALSAELTGAVVEGGAPRGVHFQEPDRPEMQATLALVGPGVARGAELGTVRLIDVAPTLCALLGIDPPASAAGAVLERALARRPEAAAGGPP